MKTTEAFDAPLVSVIVPNFNHADYLDERLNSIFSQTNQEFEIIILDDASTDNSAEVIEKYRGHPKVKQIVLNSVNSGSGYSQWKKGIDLARGEYIWIAESDDLCAPTFLEELITAMRSDIRNSLVFSKTTYINGQGQSGKIHEYNFPGQVSSDSDWRMDGNKFCQLVFCKYNLVVNASSALFRKDTYIQCGGVHTQHRVASDWMLWWDLCRRGNVAYVSKKLNCYRIHSSNTSAKWIYELPIAYDHFIENWPQNSDKKEFFAHLRIYAVELYQRGYPKVAFRISRYISLFHAVKLYFYTLIRRKSGK